MKICFVVPGLSPEEGGWGRYASDLIECARESGHEVSRIVISSARPTMRDFLRVRRVARNADIVYAIDGWPFGVIAWLGTRFLATKLMIGAVGTYTIAPLYSWKTGWLTSAAYAGADKIIAISDYTRDQLLKKVPTANVDVVTPGIDTNRWDNSEHHVMSNNIISVGALKERKGYYTALEAFAEAKKKIPDLRWILVGDDSHRDYVRKLKERAQELGVEHDIRIMGMVSDEELRRLYSESALFILLSENQGWHFEGFGIVFLEAAAAGLPVVGTTGNGIEDAVGPKNGVLVPQRNAQAATDATVSVLSDEQRWQAMSEESLKWGNTHGIDGMREAHEVIYRTLMR